MAKELVYIDREDLLDNANALREKLGTTDKFKVPNFGSATRSIQTGGNTDLNLQSKTINPAEYRQRVNPDADYNGLSEVTVNAISSTFIGSSIARRTDADVDISESAITIPSGYYANEISKEISTATIHTDSKTGSGNASIIFNNLPSEPKAWTLCSNTDVTTTAATYGIVNAYYNGSSYSGLTIYESRSNQQSRTYTPTITATYSDGTLTITATGRSTSSGSFQNTRTYNLIAIC